MIDYQIYTENLANSMDEKLRMIDSFTPTWNFVIIFLAILVIVLNKQLAPQRLKQLTSILYQSFDSTKMTREWNPLTSLCGISITLSYIALMGLFIQKSIAICSGNNILYNNETFYMTSCIFTGAFILVRYLFINIIGASFDTRHASQHQATVYMSMSASANYFLICLLLILVIHPFRSFVLFGSVVLLLFTLLRIVKIFIEFQFLIKNETLKIFLYLCTLEIVPIAIAITMAVRLIATDCVL